MDGEVSQSVLKCPKASLKCPESVSKVSQSVPKVSQSVPKVPKCAKVSLKCPKVSLKYFWRVSKVLACVWPVCAARNTCGNVRKTCVDVEHFCLEPDFRYTAILLLSLGYESRCTQIFLPRRRF